MGDEMNEIFTITAEQLLRESNAPSTTTMLWRGHPVTITPLLPLSEVTQFVNSVMSGCYNDKLDAMMPEMKDFGFRVNAIMRYAHVDMPDDIDKQYEIVYNTDIFEKVISHVNAAQLRSIEDAIDVCIIHSI